jgi:predicted kinase
MKELFLLRGLPGSGKTTLAKSLVKKDYCHKEADMFFVDRDGNYKFEPLKIKDAHQWCQEEIDFLMRLEHSPIVVSNTFTQEWEMDPYYKLAEQHGYRVYSLVVENRHSESEDTNIHNVSKEKIDNMRKRFQIKL